KALVATAGAEVVATAAVVIPQAYASGPGSTASETPRTAIPGTAWVLDEVTDQMVVTADSTVTGDRWNTLMATVRAMGDQRVRVERSAGQFRLFAEGGDAIFTGNARCSLGFNVTTSDN